MYRFLFWVTLAVATAGLGLSAIWASSSGTDPGFSGGPMGGGLNCTACHIFNAGNGAVELFGAPRRYRDGAVYDLTARIADPDQAGAGFEISSESDAGHLGSFIITDPVNTKNAGFGEPIRYVTHSRDGYRASLDSWTANGGSFEYHLGWQAPALDEGPVTFFLAGNAVNDAQAIAGDNYYVTYQVSHYAHPGDGDGDTDVDLWDFALLQRCFSEELLAPGEAC
jgi:hypothetical protein